MTVTRAQQRGAARRALVALALTAVVGGRGIATAGDPGPAAGQRVGAATTLEAQDAALERARVTYRVALRGGADGFERYLDARGAASLDAGRRLAIEQLARAWRAVPLPDDYHVVYERDLARRLDAGGGLEPDVHARLASRGDLAARADRVARLWSLHYALRGLDTDTLTRAGAAARFHAPGGVATAAVHVGEHTLRGDRDAGLH